MFKVNGSNDDTNYTPQIALFVQQAALGWRTYDRSAILLCAIIIVGSVEVFKISVGKIQ
jgi:hypothetical protein